MVAERRIGLVLCLHLAGLVVSLGLGLTTAPIAFDVTHSLPARTICGLIAIPAAYAVCYFFTFLLTGGFEL